MNRFINQSLVTTISKDDIIMLITIFKAFANLFLIYNFSQIIVEFYMYNKIIFSLFDVVKVHVDIFLCT